MAPDPDQMQERLDELEEDIKRTREQAEADGLLPEDDPHQRKPTFADPDPEHSDGGGEPSDAAG